MTEEKLDKAEKQLEAVRKRSVWLYNQGYMAGHDDTVEGCFNDIYPEDIDEYHDDVVADLLKESSDEQRQNIHVQ